MNILNAKAITRTKRRAGIMGLVYIFQYDGQEPGPAFQNIQKSFIPFGSDKRLQVINKFPVT
jgi:hypothetical protein